MFASGSDEGLYAWVVANYALGTLGGDPYKTTGIIELGGASAQVQFFSLCQSSAVVLSIMYWSECLYLLLPPGPSSFILWARPQGLGT